MVAFATYPIIASLAYAFYEWQGARRLEFGTLENFQRLFSFPHQERFLGALRNNVVVFVTVMVIQNGLALFLAYLLSRFTLGKRFFRTVFFLPVILSLVIVGFMWRLFLNPIFGPVNSFLERAGLEGLAIAWLGDAATALPALILVNTWRWLGFPTIVFMAGIHSVPEEYLEAARLEGANEWQVFWRITFPLLAPAFTIIFLLTFIGAMEWFELPYVMQGISGSPFYSTDTLALFFYRTAFGTVDAGISDFGMGAAIGVLLFAMIIAGSIVAARVLRSREVEL
jgi:raffinose/stachyose/melibiose transport system permease protein